MRLVYITPLAYWIGTRLTSKGKCLAYLLTQPLVSVLILWYAGQIRMLPVLLAAIAMQMSLYEFGYFMNDSWSQEREKQLGLNLHKKPLAFGHPAILGAAVATRLVFFVVLGVVVLKSTAFLLVAEIVVLCVAILAVFIAHNLILYPSRLGTFAVLYVLKYSIVVPFVQGYVGPAALAAAILVATGSYTLAYGISKKVFLRRLAPYSGNILFYAGRAAMGYLLAFAVLKTAGADDPKLLLLGFLLFLLVCLTFIALRVLSGLGRIQGRGDEGFHVHTTFSHDGLLAPEDVARLGVQYGYSRLYVTEHADTFDERKYEALRASCAKAAEVVPECHLVPGLEYGICGHHVLALGLTRFVPINEDDPQEILRLRDACDRVVWAHPYFGIHLFLSDHAYRSSLFQMMRLSDSMEVVNHKISERSKSWAWRHVFLAAATVALFGRKAFYIGLDFHSSDDWKKLSGRAAPAGREGRDAGGSPAR